MFHFFTRTIIIVFTLTSWKLIKNKWIAKCAFRAQLEQLISFVLRLMCCSQACVVPLALADLDVVHLNLLH